MEEAIFVRKWVLERSGGTLFLKKECLEHGAGAL
jgi:hypothetical protein